MRNYYLIIITLMFLFKANIVSASDDFNLEDYTYWFELGLIGKSYSSDIDGNGTVSKISLSKRRNIISYRNLTHNNGANILNCIGHALILSTCDGPTIEHEEQALLIGRKFKNTNLSLSGGVGRVTRNNQAIPDDRYSVIGLAYDAGWRFNVNHYLGFSLNMSGNINKENSIGGVYFTGILGKLK
ncbi:MAG: hypothetical protein JKY01_04835 [Pseudomonadales bacterium]|nr:hypothetical protein [Pseudomonadales bacterium]